MKRVAVHPIEEKPPFIKMLLYSLQHVLAMYSGAVAVPLVLASSIGLSQEQLICLINADLFTCGIATIIQTAGLGNKIGAKMPIVQGVSFGAVTTMIMIGNIHGLPGIYGSIIVAGLFTWLLSAHFSKMLRFFPPLVTGCVITIIGLSLLPVAVIWVGGGNPAADTYGDPLMILLASFVLLLVMIFYRCFSGFISNIAVLLGLIIGTLVSIPLGLVDFSIVSQSAFFGITTPFVFGLPVFDPGSIIAMTLVMLVIMAETTGDVIAIGEIVDKPIDEAVLAKALRADGFSTILGGIFNAFPYTVFAQNIGLLSLTGVKSRFVVMMSGVILIILGLFPKTAALVASIPNPILGGAGIAMFGMVAANGIKTLSRVKFDGTYNIMVIAVSIGVALVPIVSPTFYQKFPPWSQLFLNSGITVGSIAAIVLNAMLNETDINKKKTPVKNENL